MTTNIFIIHESVFLLYEKMYNENIYSCYTRRCTMKIFVIIDLLYNKNIYFYYT